MFESIKLAQEDAFEIEKMIKLNIFLTEKLDSTDVESFGPDDLLPVQDYEKERELFEVRDSFVDKFSIQEILEALLIDADFLINENGYVEITYRQELVKLPSPYGFKGGMARSVLREALGLKSIPPRDFDMIRLSSEPYDRADSEIAEKYMPQDFEFGDGVEPVEDQGEYLKTRDFTINEVYVHGSKIVATEQCIKDTMRNIIRITEHERFSYSGNEIGPKMKAKILRLHAEQIFAMGVSSIPQDDKNKIEKSFINPFWLCVQLDRAFERGVKVADKFTELLVENNIIPEDIQSSTDLGEYLLSKVYDFRFRNAPHLQYEIEEGLEGIDKYEYSNNDLLEDYVDTIHFGSKY